MSDIELPDPSLDALMKLVDDYADASHEYAQACGLDITGEIKKASARCRETEKALRAAILADCEKRAQAAQPAGMQFIGYQLSDGDGSNGLWHQTLSMKFTADEHVRVGGKVREVFVLSKPVQAEAPTASNAEREEEPAPTGYVWVTVGNQRMLARMDASTEIPVALATQPTASNAGEREAYVSWLAGTYPDLYTRDDAEHNWKHQHVSMLAWQARAALAQVPEQVAGDSGEPPLLGRWHHGEGHLVSGSIRIARWDCDTNPPDEFRDEVLEWVCNTLNANLRAARTSGEANHG